MKMMRLQEEKEPEEEPLSLEELKRYIELKKMEKAEEEEDGCLWMWRKR